MLLQDKTIAVTGAGGGIGGAIAVAAAREGASLVLCDLSGEALDAIAAEIGDAARERAVLLVGDAATRSVAHAMVDTAMTRYGRLDGLVCSGMSRRQCPAETFPDEDWVTIVEQGLTGPFRCAQEAGRVMLEAGRGSIVIITSTGGSIASPGIAPYAAAKAGAAGLVRQLAVEWARRGVRVNAVAPGMTLSPRGDMTFDKKLVEAMLPIGRPIPASEMAETCLFLLSDKAVSLTGQEIKVDGGATIGRGYPLYPSRET